VTPEERYAEIFQNTNVEKLWVDAADFWATLDDAMACVRLVAGHNVPSWMPVLSKQVLLAKRVLKEMGEE
jgi:hypothetical protein